MQRQARQRLQALLFRNDIRYASKTSWTPAHRRWIARVKLPLPEQQIAFEEYVQAVEEASARLERLTRAIEAAVAIWRWQPVVQALQALRGVQLIHASRLIADLCDLARFANARHLMGFLVKLIDRQPLTVAYLRHLGPYGEPISLFWQNTYYPWAVTNNLLERPR